MSDKSLPAATTPELRAQARHYRELARDPSLGDEIGRHLRHLADGFEMKADALEAADLALTPAASGRPAQGLQPPLPA